jgi:hypothetical protein
MKSVARGGTKGSENAYPRLSSDSPKLNAFWRVAPSVRLSALAIFGAGAFFLAIDLSVRTCSALHATRFRFLAISGLRFQKGISL